MKFKTLIQILLLVLLAFLSGEILLRRFWLNQIPSQVSPWFVYSILISNCFVLFWQGLGLVKGEAMTKKEKN